MLNPTKKVHRMEMARQLRELAGRTGATMTLREEGSHPIFHDREFRVTLNRNGLNVSIGVDGKGQNGRDNTYVINWHMDTGCD